MTVIDGQARVWKEVVEARFMALSGISVAGVVAVQMISVPIIRLKTPNTENAQQPSEAQAMCAICLNIHTSSRICPHSVFMDVACQSKHYFPKRH
jgi:hypothetical protein